MNGRHRAIAPSDTAFVDVLDRVLAKGIVIAYDADGAVVGLRAIRISGAVVVRSLDTYLDRANAAAEEAPASPALDAAVSAYLRRLPYGDALGPMS